MRLTYLMHTPFKQALLTAVILQTMHAYAETTEYQLPIITVQAVHTDSELLSTSASIQKVQAVTVQNNANVNLSEVFSVHDKFHRTLILSGFCLLKIAKISLNSSFFPKPIKR